MKICLVSNRERMKIPDPGMNICDFNIALSIGCVENYPMTVDVNELEEYDIIFTQLSKNPVETHDFLKNFKTRWPEKKMLCRQEGEYDIWFYMDQKTQILFFEFFKYIDVFLAHNDKDAEFFKLLTSKPVISIPSVVLTDKYKKIRVPVELRDDLVCTGYDMSRMENALIAYLIMKKDFPEYKTISIDRGSNKKEMNNFYVEYFQHPHESLNFMSWDTMIENIKNCKMAMNLTSRVAGGRVIIDFAAMGIPMIASNRFMIQNAIFPDLAVDIHDIERVRELTRDLLEDFEFRKEMSDYGISRSEQFKVEYAKTALVDKIRKTGTPL